MFEDLMKRKVAMFVSAQRLKATLCSCIPLKQSAVKRNLLEALESF